MLFMGLVMTARHKYNARKVVINGITFDSKKEAERYLHLLELEKVGWIKDIRTQVEYVLFPAKRKSNGKIERKCSYIADFVYYNNLSDKEIVEDVKGYRCGQAYALFTIKRKAMLALYNIEIQEV